MKTCSKCTIEYDDSFFEKNRRQCKFCMRDIRKAFVRKYRKTYSDEKKAIISQKHAQWYELNKCRIREIQKEYQKVRKEIDLAFKIRSNVSTLISRALQSKNSSKSDSSFLLHLPYNIQELISHIENQFETWMSWSNYGRYNSKIWNDNDPTTWTWQLDHITPQSDLPYNSMKDENFKKCWSLDNLRPLSSKQNYLDGINRTRHCK